MIPDVKLSALIVDDEPLARRTIHLLLKEDTDIGRIAECPDGIKAAKAIQNQHPDLLFLDIQMPGMTGFEVLEQIGADHMPVTVFVTAYDRYAIKAFEVHALDYLLKPFDDERFREALRRAKDYIEGKHIQEMTARLVSLLETRSRPESQTDHRPGGRHQTRFSIKSSGRVYFVDAKTIDWIEAAGNYVQLHTGKEVHLVHESMSDLQSKLDPQRFARVHRSTIVNLERIKELRPLFYGDYCIVLRDGTKLTLSRTYKSVILQMTGKRE